MNTTIYLLIHLHMYLHGSRNPSDFRTRMVLTRLARMISGTVSSDRAAYMSWVYSL